MGLEIPDALKPVAQLVACKWPEADETALLRMADRWDSAGNAITKVHDSGDKVANLALAHLEGRTHDQLQEFWKQASSDLSELATFCHRLALACRIMAALILAVKLYIIAALVELAVQIAIAAATAIETLGASAAEAAVAEVATRVAIRQALQQTLKRIAKETAVTAAKGFLIGSGKELAWEEAETKLGLRDGIDWNKVTQAGEHNAVSKVTTQLTTKALKLGGYDPADKKVEKAIKQTASKTADSLTGGVDSDGKRAIKDAGKVVLNEGKELFGHDKSQTHEPSKTDPDLVPDARPRPSSLDLDTHAYTDAPRESSLDLP
ncbi:MULTISPECIES: hypothetical protein [unclassified Nocardia]|uniref:WXG100-like domain-containing protein n=1 Tax=unclassified Nocardia TaxID=2637762 RepID=UPI001CE41A0F|nr:MULTISPECIES: hypothetical protein [unclassified Nocardia]